MWVNTRFDIRLQFIVFLVAAIVSQLVKNFLISFETGRSLPCSQKPNIGPYSKPDKPNAHPPILFSQYPL